MDDTQLPKQNLETPLPVKKKSRTLPILGAMLAVLLVVGVAVASYYVSNRLSTTAGITPNAPESQPAAGCKSDSDCGSRRRCLPNGRCSDPITPTKDQGYTCTSQNCPAPGFYCANATTCLAAAGFCGGSACSGTCQTSGTYNNKNCSPDSPCCVTTSTPTPTAAACASPNYCAATAYACTSDKNYPTSGSCSNGGVCCAPAAPTATPTPTVTACSSPNSCMTPQSCSIAGRTSVSGTCTTAGNICCGPAPTSNPTPTLCSAPNTCGTTTACTSAGGTTVGQRSCNFGQVCCQPAPIDLNKDVNNCGRIGSKCAAGQSCINGTCVTAGGGCFAPGAASCGNNTCCQCSQRDANGNCTTPAFCGSCDSGSVDIIHCGKAECDQATQVCCPSGCKPKGQGCGGGGGGTPTPTLTQPPAGACVTTQIFLRRADGTYTTTPLTSTQLSSLKVGDVIGMSVKGSLPNLKARFRVSIGGVVDGNWLPSQGYNDAAKLFSHYDGYEIRRVGTYTFESEVSTKP